MEALIPSAHIETVGTTRRQFRVYPPGHFLSESEEENNNDDDDDDYYDYGSGRENTHSWYHL